MAKRISIHGEWTSHWGFIVAATGSAVGLGNIWKFPYITGQNGGGAFVLAYIFSVLLVAVPVLIAEVILGRRGKQSPINTMQFLVQEQQQSRLWVGIGWMGILVGFLILSYYSVIGGWALAYIPRLLSGLFSTVGSLPKEQATLFVQGTFTHLIEDPERLLLWHTLFMLMTMGVVARGVQAGLEQATRFLMPMLFIVLLVLVGYAMSTDKFMQGVHFMFNADFHKLFYPNCSPASCEFSGRGVLIALGHAFFTLSLGMGAMMVYGAYLPKHLSLLKATGVIAFADVMVAILAGLAIFPIVFSNGLEPNQGPGLVFNTLPLAFGKMPFGSFFGGLFFVLLVLAAWTSSISLLEPTVAWMVETKKFTRVSATAWAGFCIWLFGLVTIFSFNIWSEVKPLSMFSSFANKTLFDLLDFVTANIMLPLGGLCIVIFAMWRMRSADILEELELPETSKRYKILRFLMRYVAPIGVLMIFLNAIGVIA